MDKWTDTAAGRIGLILLKASFYYHTTYLITVKGNR